jgi:hypothetical protein
VRVEWENKNLSLECFIEHIWKVRRTRNTCESFFSSTEDLHVVITILFDTRGMSIAVGNLLPRWNFSFLSLYPFIDYFIEKKAASFETKICSLLLLFFIEIDYSYSQRIGNQNIFFPLPFINHIYL